jgi:hypothetical protein
LAIGGGDRPIKRDGAIGQGEARGTDRLDDHSHEPWSPWRHRFNPGATGLRARGIYVGGIDEVNPDLSRFIEHSMRLVFICLLSEGSRSEDHARDR